MGDVTFGGQPLQPQKVYLVEHVDGVARPFEPGDEIRVYDATLVDGTASSSPEPDLDERRAIANRDLPASIRRLDALADPVSRAVLDLHRRVPRYDRWHCAICGDDDYWDWPCDTVEAVAGVHGISLDDFWLLTRPDDGSLDQPEVAP